MPGKNDPNLQIMKYFVKIIFIKVLIATTIRTISKRLAE